MNDNEEPIDVTSLIADMRGGIPPNCDFCNKPITNAVAEEGGQWACPACYARFVEEDRQEQRP